MSAAAPRLMTIFGLACLLGAVILTGPTGQRMPQVGLRQALDLLTKKPTLPVRHAVRV
jgi:hypothetical protein